MAKIIDRLLLALFSLIGIAASVVLLAASFNWIKEEDTQRFIANVYTEPYTAAAFIACCVVVLLISLRLLYISIRTSEPRVPSIDQRNDWGDIKISIETVENLALKAASKARGVKDLRARVRVSNAGLEIMLRTFVDGEDSIPALTEDIQSGVKQYIEEITGIPVAEVSVYIANIAQSAPTFKSRVE